MRNNSTDILAYMLCRNEIDKEKAVRENPRLLASYVDGAWRLCEQVDEDFRDVIAEMHRTGRKHLPRSCNPAWMPSPQYDFA